MYILIKPIRNFRSIIFETKENHIFLVNNILEKKILINIYDLLKVR
jgi:hypothetical protein